MKNFYFISIVMLGLTTGLVSCALAINGESKLKDIRTLQQNAELGYQWGYTRPCLLDDEVTMVWEYGDNVPTGIPMCGQLTIRTLDGQYVPFHKSSYNVE